MKGLYCFFCFLLILGSAAAFGQNRTRRILGTDWEFFKGVLEKGEDPNVNTDGWENVSIPHDWAISGPYEMEGNGSTAKLPWKGEGWYRKELDIPDSYDGKQIYLIFDGVMAFPEVFVNGQMAGSWDYGYNSFYVDISSLVQPGQRNVLAVHADTREHDSRWYPGAGIYRKVQLLVTAPVHINIWGTWITTPIIKPHYAELQIATELMNHTGNGDTLHLFHEITAPNGAVVAQASLKEFLKAGEKTTIEAGLTLINPKLWDIEHPHLYSVSSKLMLGKELVDEVSNEFGVRDIRFDPDHGFFLNGRRVQLKGVNLHHDHGPLGGAFYPRAMRRQLEIMKEMGANAIRNSHNVAAPELLEMCDEMGLLVINEIFDKYDGKAGITEQTDFEEFAHRNIKNFIIRDRNHPSVILWSVGNEIGDVQWNLERGHYRLHTMLNYVNKYDPWRPTTLVCDNLKSAKLRHFDYYDVHSWNYDRRYRLARQIEPNKSVIISESASTLSTRGFYEFPLPMKKTDFTSSLQVSSYDLHAPYWAEIADDDFMWQQEEAYIAGEFVWTGFDYLGEPTPYDNASVKEMGMADRAASRSSYFGIVDLVGIPKDRYYLYKSYWKAEETTIHILPHWNWPEKVGDTIPVFVYTNGDHAELFLNGKSMGMRYKKPKSENSTERFRLMWNEVVYQPGELKVVAYKDGLELGSKTLQTTGKVKELRLEADRKTIKADGSDLSYILVEAIDKDGLVVPIADLELQVEVEGRGSLVGVGNGNPQSFHDFKGNEVPLFYGKAMLIIKSDNTPGNIMLKVKAKKLGNYELLIKAE
ncbi:MAG: DUF4982 domain-containing protein [Bacteroidia bacterium]|nr:DUF4982 domain-containing protein [Bacteroidia bacterium]